MVVAGCVYLQKSNSAGVGSGGRCEVSNNHTSEQLAPVFKHHNTSHFRSV